MNIYFSSIIRIEIYVDNVIALTRLSILFNFIEVTLSRRPTRDVDEKTNCNKNKLMVEFFWGNYLCAILTT